MHQFQRSRFRSTMLTETLANLMRHKFKLNFAGVWLFGRWN